MWKVTSSGMRLPGRSGRRTPLMVADRQEGWQTKYPLLVRPPERATDVRVWRWDLVGRTDGNAWRRQRIRANMARPW